MNNLNHFGSMYLHVYIRDYQAGLITAKQACLYIGCCFNSRV